MHSLLVQLTAAATMFVLVAVVHGIGVAAIAHWLGLDRERRKVQRFHPRTVTILSSVALLLFALHMTEIALFGTFYLLVGALPSLEAGLSYSASAYATLGQPEVHFPADWRLFAALEGLAGFLLIGWSTAFFVTDMNKLLRQ